MTYVYLIVQDLPEMDGGKQIHGAYKEKEKAESIIKYHKSRDPYLWQYATIMKFRVRI